MRSPDTLVPHLGEDRHTKVLFTGFINKANEFLIGDWAGAWINSREGERQQSKPSIPPSVQPQEKRYKLGTATQDHSCPWIPEQQAHIQTQPNMLGEREVPLTRKLSSHVALGAAPLLSVSGETGGQYRPGDRQAAAVNS